MSGSKKNGILREVLGKNWKDKMKMTCNQMSGIKVKLDMASIGKTE